MSQPEKTKPPQESTSVKQAKAATWAQQYFGWIPLSSYVIGTAPTTTEQEEVEIEDEEEELKSTPKSQPDDSSVKETVAKTEPEKPETKPETELDSESQPEAETEQEPEKVEKPVDPVPSKEDSEEVALRKEQTRNAEVLREKFKGVASKLISLLGKTKSPDFKTWPETATLTKKVAAYRASLKTSLGQSLQQIANQAGAIEKKLEEAESWAIEKTNALNALTVRKAELTKSLEGQLDGAEKTAARGDAEDKSDVNGLVEGTRKNAAKAFAALDFEKVEEEIDRFKVDLEAISDQIKEKFTDFQKRVEGVEKGDYVRVHEEASEDYRKDLEAALKDAKTPDTLTKAATGLKSLLREVESVDLTTRKFKQANDAFPGIEQQYESIRSIKPKDLAEQSNAKTLTALQEQLENEWSELQSYQEEGQWEYFSDCVLDGRFPKLLESASELVASDGEAAEAMAAAKLEAERLQKEAEAAAKLAAEQLAEANRLRRENNKLLGIAEGERLFGNHSNTIIKEVWKRTKLHAPAAQNEGIKGAYGYTDIMTAIGQWGSRVDVGLFTRTFVPGGGNIQDKRTKNADRDEIQANFISDWDGNTINVHVNLRKADWAQYFPNRDD